MSHSPDSRIHQPFPPCTFQSIGLHALSVRQQRLIEKHGPLVSLTLRRHFQRRDHLHDRHDLQQDGCLALADCIRNHEPHRHGAFAPYAMARIRFAMSRALHEDTLVRVPYSTQRRRRTRDRRDAGGFDPKYRPKTYLMSDKQLECLFPIGDSSADSAMGSDWGRITLGEVIRDCCESAIQKTIAKLQSAEMQDDAALLVLCAEQRWFVPDDEFKRTYRQLADDLECGPTRIVRREREVFRRVARRLFRDRLFRLARRLARSNPDGLRHVPDTAELRAIKSMNSTG